VLEVEGNFDACMNVIRELSDDGFVYLVNSINPFVSKDRRPLRSNWRSSSIGAFPIISFTGWKSWEQFRVWQRISRVVCEWV
jgi:hypothetical protein